MKAILKDKTIILINSYPYKDLIKEMQGRRWNEIDKIWTVPATMENIKMLKSVIKVDAEIEKLYQEEFNLNRRLHKEKATKNVIPIAPMPIKANPFQHQIRAYNMALQAMGVIK
ncbi:hypothetical protein [Alkaliphilus oremlandii]|uniref:Uncharacterized protein n=1 Tax=Alkaliphilus oremlandii (strain OhILAs) TaxID=350688 RepID=A8MGA6_ALKOO|nr:hypothetical protein [Alkaliphilus oremlandii]ABW18834.1 hypothetical protein Clos_1289 [Alkaliphilus oremlandii OhILAs]